MTTHKAINQSTSHVSLRILFIIAAIAAMLTAAGILTTSHAYKYSGTDETPNGMFLWIYDDKDQSLTVSGTESSDGTCYLEYDSEHKAPWYEYKNQIKTVIVGGNISVIDGETFMSYPQLQSVELGQKVGQIRHCAFQDNEELVQVTHETGDCELIIETDPNTGEDYEFGPFYQCDIEKLNFIAPSTSLLIDQCKYLGLMVNGKFSLKGADIEEFEYGDIWVVDGGGFWFARKQYTGKALTPKPKVYFHGNKLTYGTDFTCKYSNNKNVGEGKVTIKGIGDFRDSTISYFEIYPKGTQVASAKAGKKQLTVTVKKQAAKMSKKTITGYQIQVAQDKNFTKKVKNYKLKGYEKTQKTIKKLASGKTYYVRVRTYTDIGIVDAYSKWSAAKSAKVK